MQCAPWCSEGRAVFTPSPLPYVDYAVPAAPPTINREPALRGCSFKSMWPKVISVKFLHVPHGDAVEFAIVTVAARGRGRNRGGEERETGMEEEEEAVAWLNSAGDPPLPCLIADWRDEMGPASTGSRV